MGEKRRLYSRSFERAAETSPADWAVAKKQSYTRRIDPEKSCKENHLREAHSCWTNRKKKKKIARPDLERKKICFGKFCAPPLKDFMVHSYFKNCSRVSLDRTCLVVILNDHTRETCSQLTTRCMIELQSTS